jgi:hypothetical protein
VVLKLLKLLVMLSKLVIRPGVLSADRLDAVDPLTGFQFGHVQSIPRRAHVEHRGCCSSH